MKYQVRKPVVSHVGEVRPAYAVNSRTVTAGGEEIKMPKDFPNDLGLRLQKFGVLCGSRL